MQSFDFRKKALIVFCILCCYSLHDYTYSQNIDLYGCKVWNFDKNESYLHEDSDKKTVDLRFHPLPQYRNCFNRYIVYLVRTNNRNVCDYHPRRGKFISNKTVAESGHIKIVQFGNLTSGIYCFVITPCRLECCGRWSLHTDVLFIQESKERPAGSKVASSSVSEIISIIILIFVFVSGMFMYSHYKLRKRRKKTLQSEELIQDEEISLMFYPEDCVIHILHSTDEDTTKKIFFLKDFLVNCAKLNNVVTLEEELYLIYADNRSWLRNLLKKNKKIIFVQDKKVSNFMEYNIKKWKKDTSLESLSSNQSEVHDQWLEYGKETIRIDWRRCFHDYDHLFVVFIYDISSYHRPPDDITPRRCYSSPNDLVNLCLELSGKYDPDELESLKKQLKQDLKNHPVKDIFL